VYLFDTDIISNIVKKKPSPYLIERLRVITPEIQYISTITVGELVYGAFKSVHKEKHLEQLNNKLLPLAQLIPFDNREAFIYGEIRSGLEKRGMPLSDMDLMIASTAIANDLVLITGNERHFTRIKGLRVENWLEKKPSIE
jgi:tRNA(fMet)-specific endonuclease VapC